MSRARTNKENRPKRPSTLGLLLGGTGGRKDASKGAEAERQRRRRERDRSREMAAYVGYDAMYRDGIAQVMPGVFSQTVEFSDISYQSARKEARETAFTVMSSLFNYFPADSHVQLQVVNAPIPADEVGRKVFFEPGERATAGLAEEYNRILNDKMREGVSNLVRHRYLTYAVGADDVDAAVPKLARIRGDVEQTLARIRCSSRALDGAERLELLQGQLRPGSRFEFSWDKLSPTSGARTKDFVMPSTLDFKPEGRSDCFRSDGRYGAVLAVRSFGSVIEETYLASIIDLPLPLNVTLHVQPIAQSEALALVKRQIDWMDKEIIDEQMSAVKKGYDYQILPPELRFSKEEAEELLDFLRNKSERLFVYTGLVYTWADSLEELDRREALLTEQEKNSQSDKDKFDEMRRSLDQDRKKFEDEKNRYVGYKKNVLDLASKLGNMPPKESVPIMTKWEDTLLIDVLRQMDKNASDQGKQSITPYLISLMPKDKAARIMYLMTQI